MTHRDDLITDCCHLKWQQKLCSKNLQFLSQEPLHCSPETEVWIMCLHMCTWTTKPLATGLNRSDTAENCIHPHLPKLPRFHIRASRHRAGQKGISVLILIAVAADSGLSYMTYTRKINKQNFHWPNHTDKESSTSISPGRSACLTLRICSDWPRAVADKMVWEL